MASYQLFCRSIRQEAGLFFQCSQAQTLVTALAGFWSVVQGYKMLSNLKSKSEERFMVPRSPGVLFVVILIYRFCIPSSFPQTASKDSNTCVSLLGPKKMTQLYKSFCFCDFNSKSTIERKRDRETEKQKDREKEIDRE